MKIFRTEEELRQAYLPPAERRAVRMELWNLERAYGPDRDEDGDGGAIVLVEMRDNVETGFTDFGLTPENRGLVGAPFEASWYVRPNGQTGPPNGRGAFSALLLTSNEFGWVFVIPDQPWVDVGLRRVLIENLTD